VTAVRERPAVTPPPPGDVATRGVVGWDVGGCATVALRDPDPDVRATLARALQPYVASAPSRAADLELVSDPGVARRPAIDVLGPAGDGTTTVSDGERLSLVLGGRRCALPDAWRDDPIVLAWEPGFPVSRVVGPLVRPTLQVALHRVGATTLPASAVQIAGGTVLVAGWSETGKTEVALALVEAGGGFVSDKWSTVRPDGRVVPFPIGAGIRRWILPYAPVLRSSLPARGRAQFTAARVAAAAAAPAAALAGRGTIGSLVAETARRGSELADRLPLGPAALRRTYGQASGPEPLAPLSAVVLLRAVEPGRSPSLAPIAPARAVERLVRSAAFERRSFLALEERAAYAFPGQAPCAAEWAAEEGDRLRSILASVPVYEVAQPFPTDPRPAADLIRRHVA
jgi:hypothetical protein